MSSRHFPWQEFAPRQSYTQVRRKAPRLRGFPQSARGHQPRHCRRSSPPTPAIPTDLGQKGKIERLHRTIGEGLIATLPQYTGGPRRANGKLYAQPGPLTLPQLQTRIREFIDAYNTEHAHASLGGVTPAQKWVSSPVPLDVVEPERLRWMLMADQTRQVLKDGSTSAA